MCWVMPPASPDTTLAWRMRSSSVVLPWSTWPMTVMTGGRTCWSVSSSSSLSSNIAWSSSSSCWPGSTRSRSAPISRANSSICSSVSDMVAVTISPFCMRKRMTSAALRFSLGANSCADTPRSMTIVPSGTGALLLV